MQVYLDCDGVLCDSVKECFVISYLAFYETYERNVNTSDPTKLWRNKTWREQYSNELKDNLKLFREYRPFIKSAEDFMLLQRAIVNNAPLANEEEYAFYREKELKPTDYEHFYKWRERVFTEDPDWWYSLHPLYHGIKEVLLELVDDPRFVILSTKEEKYIQAILHYHGIPWKLEQIKTEKKKLQYITKENGDAPSVLVDDQREFGRESLEYPAVKFYLAEWGYTKEEWFTDLPVPKLTLKEFPKLISELKKGENA